MTQSKGHLFDDPENIKRVLYLLYSCCAILLALDFILHRHTEHSWEQLPAFYPLYGFIGCVVLVLVAKWMRKGLMRSEDYYDREELAGIREAEIAGNAFDTTAGGKPETDCETLQKNGTAMTNKTTESGHVGN